ncbi:MAG TPA: ABC transporter substrate-binding protein [Candidatus Mediterraneibacter intestinipullorum]|nr:ABC transporter substrate-binding protein [Candidatus Mediterraneibacter intestinipullorum]
MKKKFLAAGLAAAMMLSLAACGGNDTQGGGTADSGTDGADQTSQETITLNVAYMPNYGSLWSVMTAIEKGYFEEEGIEVKLTEFQDGPNIISAMESGSIDIGYIGQGAHKLCIEGNATIFALSHISNGDAVIGGPGVTSIEDLAGKTVAYSSGTSSQDILELALSSAGMTMDDIQATDMAAENIPTAIISGSVDAAATWSPGTLTILDEVEGAAKLCDNMTFKDTTVSLASWICTPSYAEDNRDTLVKFTRALFKGMDYAADENYEEVAQWVADQTATDYDTVYSQRGDADWLTGKEVSEGAADGTVEGYYTTQKQNLLDQGAVTVDPAVTDYVMLDIMTEAGE